MENSKMLVPGAIVVAALLVAGAVVYVNSNPATGGGGNGDDLKVEPPTAEDHLLGNPNAPVVLIEYSDLECPFCKTFHQTVKQVMEEYGKDGRVAWVYRHFPLTQIHPKAIREAEASECAAELGGELAFWEYLDRIFEITPSNNGLDLDVLPEVAEELGIDREQFEECLDSGRHRERVQNQYDQAVAAGGRGTPYSIILTKDGDAYPINGAQPIETLRNALDGILQSIGTEESGS